MKAALVTGGSGGIGLAIARVMADEGYALTLAARRPEPLEAAAADLRRTTPVEAIAGNLADPAAVAAAVDRHRAAYGRMDVLVNNAGRGIMSPLEEQPDKHVELQLDLNLRSLIHCTKLSLPLLRAAAAHEGTAHIINLSSIAGKQGTAGLSVYSAAKAGVVGFTEAVNAELAPQGIRATALCPAEVDTPLTDPFRETIPGDEMIQVDDVAEIVRCLLNLSRYCLVPEVAFLRVDRLPAEPL